MSIEVDPGPVDWEWHRAHKQRWDAARNVGNLLGGKYNPSSWPDRFARMIGYSCWDHLLHLQHQKDPQLLNKLDLLAGPHALTILKAIQARNHGSGLP